MQFEWHEEKAESNLNKHGISFVAAISVFDDKNRIEEEVIKIQHGELRIKTIGMVNNEIIIVVVYTNRVGKIRIISARKANKNEKTKYYNS